MGETDTGEDVTVGAESSDVDATDEGSSTEEESQGSDESSDDAEFKDDESDDAPVRKPKTPADFVAMRRQKKIEKMQSKDEGSADEGEESDDEDGLADEDARAIDRHLDKRLKPLLEKEASQELLGEINAFVKNNPDFADLAPRVEKWMNTPEWKNIPVDKVFFAVAGKKLLKIGAERMKVASEKARQSKTGGVSGGEGTGGKPISQMTDAEFDAHVEEVKRGRRN